MSIFDTFRVSTSALTAERLRMDAIAGNVANVETTRTPEGGPYLRRQVVFQAQPGEAGAAGQGVQVVAIRADAQAVRKVHDPSHPDADANGDVLYPDIDVVTEMTDMMAATRAYQANITVFNAAKDMAARALGIGRA